MHKRRWEEARETAAAVPLFPEPTASAADEGTHQPAKTVSFVACARQWQNLAPRSILIERPIHSTARG
jgi:hypothetical protein